jgi:hypothetical protein
VELRLARPSNTKRGAMKEPNEAELERRFAEGGVPARYLYPWWFKTYRAMGIWTRPPVLYRWSEHLLYTGSGVAAVLILGGIALWFLDRADAERLLPMAVLVLIIPSMNWLRYHRIRRRLGL